MDDAELIALKERVNATAKAEMEKIERCQSTI